MTGERREAISKGFRIIADYIFGNNTASQKVRDDRAGHAAGQ